MDSESKRFGRGPKELTGAVDLINYYKLLPHYDFISKKSLPISITDTHYIRNVVGDTEIRKGEGMELNQVIKNTSFSRDINTGIQPLDLIALRDAFHLRESSYIDLPRLEKGISTEIGISESKDKEKKHKKHKNKEHKKHKHHHKGRSKHHEFNAENFKKPHEKKRKHDGDEDLNGKYRHKNSKPKSSKMEGFGAIRIAA
ncbi:hypothetical protein LXL04_036688 [Taraxacum kok-saghyz]